jgi:hypothetical protein
MVLLQARNVEAPTSAMFQDKVYLEETTEAQRIATHRNWSKNRQKHKTSMKDMIPLEQNGILRNKKCTTATQKKRNRKKGTQKKK